jgi:hypothetical protein
MAGLLRNLGVIADATEGASGEPFAIQGPSGNNELGAWHTGPLGT